MTLTENDTLRQKLIKEFELDLSIESDAKTLNNLLMAAGFTNIQDPNPGESTDLRIRQAKGVTSQKENLIKMGGFPLGARITTLPKQDQKGPPKPVPLSKKGSTG